MLPSHDSSSQPDFIKEKIAMRVFASIFHLPVPKSLLAALALLISLPIAAHTAQAQSLGYEGPTGVFVTPLALVSPSPAKGLGQPSVAYHFLAAGPIVGDFSTVSVTEGFAQRFEFGYTHEIHNEDGGSKAPLGLRHRARQGEPHPRRLQKAEVGSGDLRGRHLPHRRQDRCQHQQSCRISD
jgi:hypothetical protein